ncbi:MAG: hypothetical protein GF346_04655 [Candidatus Eisenbacteria bacterium]|nr:hypothetical protein [Candidatus Latescibacterota bacterium]MBD3301716.1 hypothetical protein [Candidatus Eisenbacteria bacterium]
MALLVAICALALPLSAGAAGIDSLVPLPGISTFEVGADLRLAPHALALDPLGRVWALDRARGRIVPVREERIGESVAIEAPRGRAPSSLSDLAASGSYLYLLDSGPPRILLADLDGHARDAVDLSAEIEAAGLGGGIVSLLLVDRSGTLSLIESGAGRLVRLDRRGRFVDTPLESLSRRERPERIADARLAPGDETVLLDPVGPTLFTLSPDGVVEQVVRLDTELTEPMTLAIDAEGARFLIGSGGRVVVVDRKGDRVWDGRIPLQDALGPHRAVITREGILLVSYPSKGAIDRWRIARAASGRGAR